VGEVERCLARVGTLQLEGDPRTRWLAEQRKKERRRSIDVSGGEKSSTIWGGGDRGTAPAKEERKERSMACFEVFLFGNLGGCGFGEEYTAFVNHLSTWKVCFQSFFFNGVESEVYRFSK